MEAGEHQVSQWLDTCDVLEVDSPEGKPATKVLPGKQAGNLFKAIVPSTADNKVVDLKHPEHGAQFLNFGEIEELEAPRKAAKEASQSQDFPLMTSDGSSPHANGHVKFVDATSDLHLLHDVDSIIERHHAEIRVVIAKFLEKSAADAARRPLKDSQPETSGLAGFSAMMGKTLTATEKPERDAAKYMDGTQSCQSWGGGTPLAGQRFTPRASPTSGDLSQVFTSTKTGAALAGTPSSAGDRPHHTVSTSNAASHVKDTLGKKKKKLDKRKKKLADREKREDEKRVKKSLVTRLSVHPYFEWFSIVLIMSNAAFLAWQTQYLAEKARDDAALLNFVDTSEGAEMFVMSTAFTMLFAAELGIRWLGLGCRRFFDPDDNDNLGWNILDMIVVGFGLIDIVFSLIIFFSSFQAKDDGEDQDGMSDNVTLFRVLRIIRVVRVFRIVRVVRFFRELRIMVSSILGSMKLMFWAVVVLGMFLFMVGMSFASSVVTYLDTAEKWKDPENEDMILLFGTLDRSILSLYMAMSGGDDWGNFYSALVALPFHNRVLFVAFIGFAQITVLNIVTGVFVNSAMETDQNDKEIIIEEELQRKKEYLEAMGEIFLQMDEDETGKITYDEFVKVLDDEKVVAYFNVMKLDITDAEKVFHMLDVDEADEDADPGVDIMEFLDGCYRLQGESRALDMKIMQFEMEKITKWLPEMQVNLLHLMHIMGVPSGHDPFGLHSAVISEDHDAEEAHADADLHSEKADHVSSEEQPLKRPNSENAVQLT